MGIQSGGEVSFCRSSSMMTLYTCSGLIYAIYFDCSGDECASGTWLDTVFVMIFKGCLLRLYAPSSDLEEEEKHVRSTSQLIGHSWPILMRLVQTSFLINAQSIIMMIYVDRDFFGVFKRFLVGHRCMHHPQAVVGLGCVILSGCSSLHSRVCKVCVRLRHISPRNCSIINP